MFRIIENNYINYISKSINNIVIYPIKNPGFNLSISKFYDDQYIICIRNIVPLKVLIKNNLLYPGFKRYSKINESNMHNNNNLSNDFFWNWDNNYFYEDYIFIVGTLDLETLIFKPNINIKPLYLLNPKTEYDLPNIYANMKLNTHLIKVEDFRMIFYRKYLFLYDSQINLISKILLIKNKLIYVKLFDKICGYKFSNKLIINNNYHKVFEKNWSLYDIIFKGKLPNIFKFIHDYEIDGVYAVSYNCDKNNCKKYKIVNYKDNLFPINSKYIRFSFGTPTILIENKKYLGVGHIKIKYNYFKKELKNINLNIEKYYISIAQKLHLDLKKKYGKIYRPHRFLMYMFYYFIYNENNKTIHISDLYIPIIKNYKYIFSLSFPMSIIRENDFVIVSSGYGDYTNFLLKQNLNDIIKLTNINISNLQNVEFNYHTI